MGIGGQVALDTVLGSCSSAALDLTRKLLLVDPEKRLTATDALRHPFLSKYHMPQEEPICIPAFNFDFEKEVRFIIR